MDASAGKLLWLPNHRNHYPGTTNQKGKKLMSDETVVFTRQALLDTIENVKTDERERIIRMLNEEVFDELYKALIIGLIKTKKENY